MSKDWFGWAITLAIVGVLVLAVVLAVVSSVEKERRWKAFAASHACRVVAHVTGSTFNTYGVDGKGGMTVGVGSIPEKTGYLCNDGITYYRDK